MIDDCSYVHHLSSCIAFKPENLRDSPQTELDSEISALFPLNKLVDPQFSVLVFAKNSLTKNIFEERKKV